MGIISKIMGNGADRRYEAMRERVARCAREIPKAREVAADKLAARMVAKTALDEATAEGQPYDVIERLEAEFKKAAYYEGHASNDLNKAIEAGKLAEQDLAAAKAASDEAAAHKVADERVKPAVMAALTAFAELQAAVGRDWHNLHGLMPDNLAVTLFKAWLAKMESIDNPPAPRKAPAGTVAVRFIRSYPGSNNFPSIPPYAEGVTAGFVPDGAKRLIDGGYAVRAKSNDEQPGSEGSEVT